MTTPVNVRYLTGFESTNAALLVEPERAVLFSDFRYAEAGRKVEGVEFVEVERALLRGVVGHVEGSLGFESAHLTHAGWEFLRSAGLELVPRSGLVEQLRAVKDDDELGVDPASRRARERGVQAAGGGALHRPDRARARVSLRPVRARARRGRLFVPDRRRVGAERRDAARAPRRPRDRARRDGRRRRRRARRRVRLGLHAHVRDGRPARRARARLRRRARGAARRARRRRSRRHGQGRGRRGARRDRGRGARQLASATGSVTASACSSTRRRRCGPSRRTRSRRTTSSPSSPASTCPGSAGSGSRTWSSCARAVRSC